jgi:hypothetical protein
MPIHQEHCKDNHSSHLDNNYYTTTWPLNDNQWVQYYQCLEPDGLTYGINTDTRLVQQCESIPNSRTERTRCTFSDTSYLIEGEGDQANTNSCANGFYKIQGDLNGGEEYKCFQRVTGAYRLTIDDSDVFFILLLYNI